MWLQFYQIELMRCNIPDTVWNIIDKTKDLENLKQGDFVKIFGQEKTSIDNNGKEHKNVRILSSKLLKAKEQVEESRQG